MNRLVGLGHWAVLLARGRRCWACHRRLLAHWPWQWADCQRTPLALVVVELVPKVVYTEKETSAFAAHNVGVKVGEDFMRRLLSVTRLSPFIARPRPMLPGPP
jgi:hypothetical protein